MSTIVYRDGVMASDTRGYEGRGEPPIGFKHKTRRLDDGTLIGCSSSCIGGTEFVLEWYARGCPKLAEMPGDEKPTSFRLLAVRPDGKGFIADDAFFLSGPLEAPYWAIGSGGEIAWGALWMGADATKAIEAAIAGDVWSGGTIDILRH